MGNIYVTLLQLLQFQYQKGCLYRLRSLGERKDMDITIDGFHSWMWKGLVWLLPFLYLGYLFEIYNAYALYYIYIQFPDATWHVAAMSIPKKLKDRTHSLLKYRFTRLDKYFWSHRRRRDSDRQANPKFSDEVDRVLRRSNSEIIRNSLSKEIPEGKDTLQNRGRKSVL